MSTTSLPRTSESFQKLEKLCKDTSSLFTWDEEQKVFNSLEIKNTLGIDRPNTFYDGLRLLQKQGQIKEDNVVMIEKCFAQHSSRKDEIQRVVGKYKSKICRVRPLLTGRDDEIEVVTAKLQSDESAVVNLYGESGVGKTTLAKEICYRWEKSLGRSVMVDLREVKEMKYLYFDTLHTLEPDKTILVYDEEAVLKRVRGLTEEDKVLLVLFDNCDQFAGGEDEESKSLQMKFLGFLERLKSPEVDKFNKLRILLTAVNQFAAEKSAIEDVYLKPLEKRQSGELLMSEGELHIAEEQKSKVLQLCAGRPLLLKILAAAVKQEGVKLKNLISNIEERFIKAKGKPIETVKPSGEEKPDTKESEPERTTREELKVDVQDSSFLRPMFFNLPSKELQDAVVSLSLFCRPFLPAASARVLNVEEDKAIFLLECLRSYNFITIEDPSANELIYDIHPMLKAFVNDIRNEADFKQVFREAETRFSHWFMDKATSLAKLLDGDYVKVLRMFNEERANYELALDITTNRDHLFISDGWYHDNAMLAFLFDAMLNRKIRRKLFQSWADTAEKEGKDCLAANLRCWEALQVLESEGSHRANEVLKKAEVSISNVAEKDTDLFRLTKAKYLFTLGKIHRKLYDEPEGALQEYEKSLGLMDQFLPGDHTEKARCLNAIGNCYQRLNKPDKAIDYFQRVHDMRRKLSGELHYDMPVYKSQIGTVCHRKGDYDQAIKHYQSAIELEEKLKISGYESTAVYYRNIASAYLFKDEYAKALEPATKAYEIRNEILGKHPETTRSLYQLGLIWDFQNKLSKALPKYKEAWEMEKSLRKGNHSEVRDEIFKRLRSLSPGGFFHRKEKKLLEEDALEFYLKLWEEERSFEEFEPSASSEKIMNMIIDLYKSLGSNKDPEYERKRLNFFQEALEDYKGQWKELEREKEKELGDSKPHREQVVDKILLLASSLKDKKTEKEYKDIKKILKKGKYVARRRESLREPEGALVKTEEMEEEEVKLREEARNVEDDWEDAKEEEHTAAFSDEDDDYEQISETVKVSSQGSVCDFKSAGVHITFPPGAVTKPLHVTCSVVNPDTCKLPTAETEVLVSNVVELSPLDLTFSKDVTLALSYSATKLRDYEVIVKELNNKESNTWKELHTVDTKKDTDEGHQEAAAQPPTIKTTIRRAGIFAVICRLASHSFSVTAKGYKFSHPKFSSLKVDIPAGAVSGESQIKVNVKVQEIPAEDLNSPHGYACAVLHLHTSTDVSEFLKPVMMSIPVTLGDKHIIQKSSWQARVFFCRSRGSVEDWEDVTDRLDEAPTLNNGVVRFQVYHFSAYCPVWVTKVKDEASEFIRKLGRFIKRGPSFPAMCRVCIRKNQLRDELGSIVKLHLFCMPIGIKNEQWEIYEMLDEDVSRQDLRPEEEVYVTLESGELTPVKDMEDFCLVFKICGFKKGLSARIIADQYRNSSQYKEAWFYFYKDRSRTKLLCDFSVKVSLPGQHMTEDQRGKQERGEQIQTSSRILPLSEDKEKVHYPEPDSNQEKCTSGRWRNAVLAIDSPYHVKPAIAYIRADSGSQGTGFRISKRLVMSSRHVLKDCRSGGHVIFNYSEPLPPNVPGKPVQSKRASELQLDTFYYENAKLDFAVMGMSKPEGEPGDSSDVAIISHVIERKKDLVGASVNILSHPHSRPMMVSTHHNEAVAYPTDKKFVGESLPSKEHIIVHKADTEKGSSGAPMFNDSWRLVGIHQGFLSEDLGDGKPKFFANYGTHITKILEDMFSQRDRGLTKFETQLKGRVDELGLPFEGSNYTKHFRDQLRADKDK